MPFVPRRRFTGSRRRFVGRRKRQGVWTGLSFQSVTLTAGTVSSYYLWDDTSAARLNMPGKGVHERTLLWIHCAPGDGNFIFGWNMMSYTTDTSNNVPSSAIIPPITSATLSMEKPLMEYGQRFVAANITGGSTGNASFMTIERDVRAKRKLDDTEAILISFEIAPAFGSAATSLRFALAARTYVSW